MLIPDTRGYGDSDKPAGNDGYDARSLAEDCRALVAAIGFMPEERPAYVVGHILDLSTRLAARETLDIIGEFLRSNPGR